MDIWVVHTKSLAHQQVSLTYREWDSLRGCELLNAYSVSYSKITYIGMTAGEVTGRGGGVKCSLADRNSQHPCKC